MTPHRLLLRPYDIPQRDEIEVRRFLRERLREAVIAAGIAPADFSKWPQRKVVTGKVLDRWPDAAGYFPPASRSGGPLYTYLFRSAKDDPRGSFSRVLELYFCLCAPTVEAEHRQGHVRKEFQAWKDMRRVDSAPLSTLALRLLIPPSLDGLLLGGRDIRGVEEPPRSSRRSSRQAESSPPCPIQAEVSKLRYAELLRGQRASGRKPSTLFYMSWQRALDAQERLAAERKPDPILVLDKWAMVTTPACCLLQAGPAGYLTDHASRMRQLLGSSPPGEKRFALLAEWLSDATVICAKETNAANVLESFLDRFREAGLVEPTKKPVHVSSITTLLELMAEHLVPEPWVLVGGPLQYWTVRARKLCHILDATQEIAGRTRNEDKKSHYVIATRACFLSPGDSLGQRAASALRTVAQEIQRRFNDEDKVARQQYRQEIAKRLEDKYSQAEGQSAGITPQGILDFIDHGMSLRIGASGGFVPLEEFSPPHLVTADR